MAYRHKFHDQNKKNNNCISTADMFIFVDINRDVYFQKAAKIFTFVSADCSVLSALCRLEVIMSCSFSDFLSSALNG